MLGLLPINKVIHEGEIIIDKIVDMDTILFDPPVKCRYVVFSENRYDAIIEFEFGLQMTHRVDPRLYFNKDDSTPPTVEQMVRNRVIYDLAHAFLHISIDPNYLHLHWALKGWIGKQAKVIPWVFSEDFDNS